MWPDFWEPEAKLDITRRHRRGLLPEKRKNKVHGEEQGKGGNRDVGGLTEPYRAVAIWIVPCVASQLFLPTTLFSSEYR
jgi:hypothetical protein